MRTKHKTQAHRTDIYSPLPEGRSRTHGKMGGTGHHGGAGIHGGIGRAGNPGGMVEQGAAWRDRESRGPG